MTMTMTEGLGHITQDHVYRLAIDCKQVAYKTTIDSSRMPPREGGSVYEGNNQTNK